MPQKVQEQENGLWREYLMDWHQDPTHFETFPHLLGVVPGPWYFMTPVSAANSGWNCPYLLGMALGGRI